MMTNTGGRRFIAVDGGGTKTALLIGDEFGNILNVSYGGSSNMKSRPWEEVKDELAGLIRQGLERSDTTAGQVEGIVLGLAGSDRPEDRARVQEHVWGLLGRNTGLAIYNDAVTALAAGTNGESGMVLIAGTGSICCGFDPATGEYVRVGGWGYVFGDEGSGFDLGRRALQAVMKAYDGRAQATLLTNKILGALSVASPDKLITAIYESATMRATVASLSKAVFEAAKEGDEAAQHIAADAARELAAITAAAHARMSPAVDRRPLILSGGVFQDLYFLHVFKEQLPVRAIALDIRLLSIPPVIGSYYFALKQAGLAVTEDMIIKIEQQCSNEGEWKDGTIRKSHHGHGASE